MRLILGEFLLGFKGLEVVLLSFAIPFFEGSQSARGDRDGHGLSIRRIHQTLGLEVGKKLALDLHVGVRDELSRRHPFSRDNAGLRHNSEVY
jgi:hypothetical protein